jgi:hypothetical protein
MRRRAARTAAAWSSAERGLCGGRLAVASDIDNNSLGNVRWRRGPHGVCLHGDSGAGNFHGNGWAGFRGLLQSSEEFVSAFELDCHGDAST